MSPTARELVLTNWVSEQLQIPKDRIALKAIASDAGFRRYFRFVSPNSMPIPTLTPMLAVDAPPQTEDTRQFVALARYLRAQGVRTPSIIAADEPQGLLLVEDFGDRLLFSELDASNVGEGYHTALKTLLSLQQCQDSPTLIPRYDRALLRRELEIFSEWFVGTMLGYSLNADETALLERTFTLLEDAAIAQPQTLVHRDYHSRNLILCDDGELGVIDFQGALWGAVTYDLVSLLRDCYLRWPADHVKRWALDYRQMALTADIIPATTEAQFLQDFDWMGLQRHIKVLGIFARLQLRDGKTGYLKDLPLVIRYTLEIASQYSELRPFADWFVANLLPLAQQQPWYSDYSCAGESCAGVLQKGDSPL